MHTRFSLVSVKQSLQWKLPSVLRTPSTFPSPADAQNFPGWMWDAESRTIPEFSEMVPAEDLGESQQTEWVALFNKHPSACPGAAVLGLPLPASSLWLPV